MSVPTILKLGGSVITRKEKPMTPNLGVLHRLADEIAAADVENLIVVHGGGSYGHPIAKEYEIKEGYKDKSQIEGFSKTHQAMLALNKLVVDALIHNGVPAFSVSPSSCTVMRTGRIQVFYDNILSRLLNMGLVPTLFGDAVVDNSVGFTILSGDQLVATLATRFGAGKMIFAVDVDGIYTADPKIHDSARILHHITLEELKTLLHAIEGTEVTDVTGGMLGKISELIPAIDASIPAIIVNATVKDNVYKVLKGEKTVCTLIEKE